jgi:hypothetical protein
VGIALSAGERTLVAEVSAEHILSVLKESTQEEWPLTTIIDRNGQWLASSSRASNPPGRFIDFSGYPLFKTVLSGREVSDDELFMGRSMVLGGSSQPSWNGWWSVRRRGAGQIRVTGWSSCWSLVGFLVHC